MVKRLCAFGKSVLEGGTSFQNPTDKCPECIKYFKEVDEPECFIPHISDNERYARFRATHRKGIMVYEHGARLTSNVDPSEENLLDRIMRMRKSQLEQEG